MQPIRTFVRKAEAARELLRRLATAYAKRPAPPPPAPPAPEPARPRAVNWELRSPAELVAHIEQHYHAGLRRDLPALIAIARDVERTHARHASVPAGLADVLEAFFAELESHMQKEEAILFPVLRTGARSGSIDMPMRMMEREHERHEDQLAQIRALTAELRAPADADVTWRTLYTGLATLEAELRQHIYLENNVLFARASGGDY